MSINLAEIQQKVDRLLYNIAEQNRRAYQMFYDPTPQDVELPQLDENGNLITVTIPNRAKIKQQMWDDVNAAVGLWNRTFYVDQTNGDDNNPGTADAPFATIEKAINSVPIGGYGQIWIKGSVETQANLEIINKNLRFIFTDGGNLIFKSYVYDTYNAIYGWKLINSLIEFHVWNPSLFPVVKVDNSAYDSTLSNHSAMQSALRVFSGAIVRFNSMGAASLTGLGQQLIEISPNGYSLISCDGGFGSQVHRTTFAFEMAIESGGYFKIGSNSAFIRLDSKGVGLLGLIDPASTSLFEGIQDELGNSLGWADVITGIVKDANGVPRNIISTIIF